MNIEELCRNYNLGEVKDISKLTGGLMHKMYKVETDKDIYAIKVLNKEVMSRSEAYDNFIISSMISNLAYDNNIPVSNALKINNDYIIRYKDNYYMVFKFVEGRVLKDDEITINHTKKIGNILSIIHDLDYSVLGLSDEIKTLDISIDWDKYIDNPKFKNIEYKDLYLANYKKYNSIFKRSVERYNDSNKELAVCHLDMDPKNVMWNNDNPIIIDWECASLYNPYMELLEVALNWSGFLSDKFDENKFISIFREYSKNNDIIDVDWYSIICGNLVNRFNWLDYNIRRSLEIVTSDNEEIEIGIKEVIKTINEINKYLDLIGPMDNLIENLDIKIDNSLIEKIISNNDILANKKYEFVNAGFTNTIYKVDNYIVRICTDINNEDRFRREIDFYSDNKDNKYIPNFYIGDISKKVIPYYYEIIEKIEGIPLYDVWYKLDDNNRLDVIKKIVEILKSIHSKEVDSYDYLEFIKTRIEMLVERNNLDINMFKDVIDKCDIYFKDNVFGLLHGDLHFDNFIYNNGNVKLIDFERVLVGPIDYDFSIFNMCISRPWKWASVSSDMLAVEDDYKNIMDMFKDNYEVLKTIKYLDERLIIYEIEYTLRNYRDKDKYLLNELVNKLK